MNYQKRFIKITLAVMLILSLQANLYSQEPAKEDTSQVFNMSLEDLLNISVTTVSKFSEKVSNAPGIISVITKEDINRYGITSMFDLMDLVADVYPLSAFSKRYAVMSARGIAMESRNKHNLLLLNGRPIKEGQNGGVEENIWAAFPVSSIERVEIIRGPGSVLYGTGAFTGVTNIITKKEEDHNVSASIETGNRSQLGAMSDGGFKANDAYLYAYGSYYNDPGWDWSSKEKYGTTMNEKLDRKEASTYLHGGWKGLELNATFSQFKDRMWMESPLPGAMNDTKISRLFTNLGYSLDIMKNWNVQVNGTYGSKVDDRSLIKTSLTNNGHSKILAQDIFGEFTTRYSINNLNLLVGGTYTYSTASDSQAWYIPETRDPLLNPDGTQRKTANVPEANAHSLTTYAQADYTWKSLKGIVGLQLNKAGSNKIDLVPRIGLIYQINEEFGAKALFAQAYRAPTIFETNINVPTLLGNPDLKSEKISTGDFQLFMNKSNMSVALTGFYSEINDAVIRILIPGSATGQNTYTNSTKTIKDYGTELEVKYIPAKHLRTFGAFSINKVEPTTYMPQTMVKFGASYDIQEFATISFYEAFYSKPDEIASIPPVGTTIPDNTHLNPDPTSISSLNGNVIMHVSKILKLFKPRIDLNIKGVNLLNQKVYITEFASKTQINSLQSLDREPLGVYGKLIVSF
jgi:outer membrane receptor for ferrienterochelin and colicins